jgi:ubiquinone/menaquinone biosynthesis C-methylase UbiE
MEPEIYHEYMSTEIEARNFEEVYKIIKELKKRKILDFCCGTGILPLKWLSKLDIEYTGVDINKRYIEYARRLMPEYTFIQGDAVTTKINKKFDIITVTSGYHHIEEERKRKFLENIEEHLKEEGKLIIYEKFIESHINSIRSGIDFYGERIKEMAEKEELNENQLFSLFNEMYLTSIRKEEYKVTYNYFMKDLEATGFEIKKEIKLWPEQDIFGNPKVGDFVVIAEKAQ